MSQGFPNFFYLFDIRLVKLEISGDIYRCDHGNLIINKCLYILSLSVINNRYSSEIGP